MALYFLLLINPPSYNTLTLLILLLTAFSDSKTFFLITLGSTFFIQVFEFSKYLLRSSLLDFVTSATHIPSRTAFSCFLVSFFAWLLWQWTDTKFSQVIRFLRLFWASESLSCSLLSSFTSLVILGSLEILLAGCTSAKTSWSSEICYRKNSYM